MNDVVGKMREAHFPHNIIHPVSVAGASKARLYVW
jgi:hypothetical protein